MERLKRLLDVADLLQTFVGITLDGLDELSVTELAELRSTATSYQATNAEEAGALAILLWLLDHPT